MASAQAAPGLRPLSLGEILDVSIKICLKNWKTLVKTVAIVIVPLQIVTTLITFGTVGADSILFDVSANPTDEELIKELNAFVGGLAITFSLALIGTLIASGACMRALAQAYLGQPADWRSSLRFAFRRLHSLLWITLLFVVAVTIAFFFFIAPSIWLYVALSFAIPALIVEDVRGFKAMARSFNLVRNIWWRTCGVLLVGTVLGLVVASIAQFVFFIPILFAMSNPVFVLVISAIAGTVGALFSTPLQASVLAVMYFDLRVRKEGFDLELLAAQIGAPAVAPVPAPAPAPAPAGAAPTAGGPVVLEKEPGDRLWPAPAPQQREAWDPPASNGREQRQPPSPGTPPE